MANWSTGRLRPRQLDCAHFRDQPTLFGDLTLPLEQIEVETRVSRDELTRWHERGWLSFNPEEMTTFDIPERAEIRFVEKIARFGLCDEWVTKFLSGLPKPYCYDAEDTFYSFSFSSWVTVRSVEEELDEYLQTLASEGEWDTLRSIQETISDLLEDEPDQTDG